MNNLPLKKIDWKKITGIFLFFTLVFSIIFVVYKLVNAPSISEDGYEKLKSDYVLMLLQCALGLVVMFIPSFIEHKLSIDIPNNMEVAYFVFLYCAIFLGEVRNFYYVIPYWDTILHAFSGGMLGALGFSLVCYFNDTDIFHLELSPFFVALFAFCFALSAGTIWEIYEFLADGVLRTNMQKFITAEGTVLSGRLALVDTMKDLIVDSLSALVVTIVGFYSINNKKKKS
jgi:mannose/fructose/N-acetylgalactosamine-specific phosphotransferase system component IIC